MLDTIINTFFMTYDTWGLGKSIIYLSSNKETGMKPIWKWIIGIVIGVVVLGFFVMPLFIRSFYGYGMMSGWGSTWGMPMHGGFGYSPWTMMGGGYGFMGTGMIFPALIQLGVLILIVLGIIWLVRELRKQNQQHSN
jgi:hypothetical protein